MAVRRRFNPQVPLPGMRLVEGRITLTQTAAKLYRRLQMTADLKAQQTWSRRVPRPLDQKYRIIPHVSRATEATFWRAQEWVIGEGWVDIGPLSATPGGAQRAIIQAEGPV